MYCTSNVTGRRRRPKRKLRAGYRAPSLKRRFHLSSSSVTDVIVFVVECDIARFLCSMRVFEVRASSLSLMLPLCQIWFLLRPPLLSSRRKSRAHSLNHSPSIFDMPETEAFASEYDILSVKQWFDVQCNWAATQKQHSVTPLMFASLNMSHRYCLDLRLSTTLSNEL